MLSNNQSLALLTDLYQLTMAYGYWKAGVADREAVFHLYFRKNPFGGGFSIACGLEDAIAFLENFAFDESDLAYLKTLKGNDGAALFEPAFLDYLRALQFSCDVDAMPEGTVAFPSEPLLRVRGPIIACQLVETALLNIINFGTLIATKAARVCLAARGEPVLEFGARRAQGPDGALTASRAAYIGGCEATSNVLAGKTFGIPVRGTHAHSWVMLFGDELEAFKAYAKAMPNNCVFLVDTYNTLEGVRHAVQVGHWLKPLGYRLAGIRLDSGDLAYLSIEARRILDEAGLKDAAIVASNDLDETLIASLKEQGARINVWGVGTRLVTGGEQAALGGVYKLSAVRDGGESGGAANGDAGAWISKIKVSEQTAKVSNPGIQQVRRYRANERAGNNAGCVADAIYDIETDLSVGCTIIDPADATRHKRLERDTPFTDLLVPIFSAGRRVYDPPPLSIIRERVRRNLSEFHPGIKRFVNPHIYPVGLEQSLHERKLELIRQARQTPGAK